ncbi:MAG: hypothetical protein ACYDAG_06755, partial [Chloroflexota bacterium]
RAQGLLRLPLEPDRPVELVAPSTLVEAAPAPAGFAKVSAGWQRQTHQVRLDLPDATLEQAYYASLAYILVDEHGNRIHPGPLLHDAFWVRDAGVIGYALERAGLASTVRGSVEATLRAIGPTGQVAAITNSNGKPRPDVEWDAPGEAAFGLVEYARFAHNTTFLRDAYPAMKAALANAMAHRDASGLLPPNLSAEDLGSRADHHYWDDFWLLTGLREASWAATRVGQPGDAIQFGRWFDQLHAALEASIARTGSAVIPNGPEDLTSSAMARGTSPALWPLAVLSPGDPLVRRSFAAYDSRFIAPFGGAYHHLYGEWWPYGGLELAHDFLFLGMRNRMQRVLEYTLKHQTAPGLYAWAEGVDPTTGGYAEGDMPHAWASAELVNLVRDSLLYEDGTRLVVGAGVPASWAGKAFSIKNAPTRWGNASLSVSAGGRVVVSGVRPPGGIELRLPFPAHL